MKNKRMGYHALTRQSKKGIMLGGQTAQRKSSFKDKIPCVAFALGMTPCRIQNDRAQSGRSMVEMLGALAIVGVLSIGGITGYTVAMDNHYANETIDRLMQRAAIVSFQRTLAQSVSLNDFDENDGTYTIPNQVNTSRPNAFILTVNNVPKAVCEKIRKKGWKTPGIWPKTACNTSNNMQFIFSDDLTDAPSPAACSNNNDCAGCQTCQNGMCADNQTKCATGSTCINGICKCPTGYLSCGSTSLCCTKDKICGPSSSTNNAFACLDPTGDGCLLNEDCENPEQFCQLERESSGKYPLPGNCVNKTSLIPIQWNNRTFYITPQLNWWSVRNLCLAHGKSIATLNSLGLAKNYSNTTGNGPLYQVFSAAGWGNKDFWINLFADAQNTYYLRIRQNNERIDGYHFPVNQTNGLCE